MNELTKKLSVLTTNLLLDVKIKKFEENKSLFESILLNKDVIYNIDNVLKKSKFYKTDIAILSNTDSFLVDNDYNLNQTIEKVWISFLKNLKHHKEICKRISLINKYIPMFRYLIDNHLINTKQN